MGRKKMSNSKTEVYLDRVCIVGGGPVGLALSLTLAKYKVPSIILESREHPTPKDQSRAITWMPRGLEFLDWLGIKEKFLSKGVKRYYHRFESKTQELLSWSFHDVESPFPYSIQLPQHYTELLLERYAKNTGLVEIRRGHHVTNVDQTNDYVQILVEHKKENYEIRAAWGIACDSAKSAIRDKLQIKKSWQDYGLYSAVADFEMDCRRDKEISNIILDPSRPYGFFYFAPSRWRFIYRINTDEDRKRATSEQFATQLLQQKLPDAKIHRFLWASSFRLGQGQSETYIKKRWILAGDAAHAMGPSAGAGMMVGLLGAWRLGWRLSLALKNHPNTTNLLTDYSREQHLSANEIQGNNAIIFRNLAIKNSILATGRSFVLKNILSHIPVIGKNALEKEALLKQKLPVNQATDHHLPQKWSHAHKYGRWILGQRIPYMKDSSQKNLFSSVNLTHTIFSIGEYNPDKEEELFSDLSRDFNMPLEPKLVRLEKKSIFRVNKNKVVFAIVRPDQHICALVSS
jgi:2-polyprenyl-6-methoxyphenol hydroxylase-like FAD-dependent oxidoreductase